MTTEIISLAVQFQLWVNQLVARRLEAEASQKAAAIDPKALIEERKKRLLGNQGGQS